MKKTTFFCLALTSFFACKNAPDNTPSTAEQLQTTADITNQPINSGGTQDITDSAAIIEVVHNFYKWYETLASTDYDYVDYKGKTANI